MQKVRSHPNKAQTACVSNNSDFHKLQQIFHGFPHGTIHYP
jgi:hypothetical protein